MPLQVPESRCTFHAAVLLRMDEAVQGTSDHGPELEAVSKSATETPAHRTWHLSPLVDAEEARAHSSICESCDSPPSRYIQTHLLHTRAHLLQPELCSMSAFDAVLHRACSADIAALTVRMQILSGRFPLVVQGTRERDPIAIQSTTRRSSSL